MLATAAQKGNVFSVLDSDPVRAIDARARQ